MRTLLPLLSLLFMTAAFGDDVATVGGNGGTAHRYILERTFPAGALAGLDATVKQKVNDNNAKVGVSWVQSYANAEKTKTYCEYEGPSEAAVRKAAQLNSLPVDKVTEVPVKSGATTATTAAPTHRFIVAQTGKVEATPVKVIGVHWVTSYANAERTQTYTIYEAPTEAAARSAAAATGATIDSVTEVPVTLLPY